MAGDDDRFRDAGWAATDAYTATPGDHQARLAAVLAAHLRELAARGLLARDPPPGLETPTVEDDARWLADAAGHPRFTDGGWANLLAAEGDILMAYRCAMDRRPGGTASGRREADVRDRLLRNLSAAGSMVGHVQVAP